VFLLTVACSKQKKRRSRDQVAMLSADDFAPTPELDDVTSSNMFRGKNKEWSPTFTRRGPSVTSLGSNWSRESIVETLEKKWRENVSSRLRNQLHAPHLCQSSVGVHRDLPVIVRPATPTPSRPATAVSSQLYQSLIQGSGDVQRHAGRCHSASPTTTSWTRSLSLSRRSKGGGAGASGPLEQEHPQTLSTSMILERSPMSLSDFGGTAPSPILHSTVFDQHQQPDDSTEKSSVVAQSSSNTGLQTDWTAHHPTTLSSVETAQLLRNFDELMDRTESSSPSMAPTYTSWTTRERQTPSSYDVQHETEFDRAGSLSQAHESGSTSSMETGGDDDRYSASDSCDEESVDSFTFLSPTPQRTDELCNISSSALLGSAMLSGTGDWSKDMAEDTASPHATETSPSDVLRSTNCEPQMSSDVASANDDEVKTLLCQRRREISCVETNDEVRQKTDDDDEEERKHPVDEPRIASTEDTRGADAPARFRTSISLTISSPAVSAARTTRLLCHSTSVELNNHTSDRDFEVCVDAPVTHVTLQPLHGAGSQQNADCTLLYKPEANQVASRRDDVIAGCAEGQAGSAEYAEVASCGSNSASSVDSTSESQQNATTERQMNGFHDVQTCTVTSHLVTSSHVTSGSGTHGPLSAAHLQDSLKPVQDNELTNLSVERSSEILRTDSKCLVRVTTHKTSFSTVVEGPQENTVIVVPVQDADIAGHGGFSVCASGHHRSDSNRTSTDRSRAKSHCLDIIVEKVGLTLGFSIDGGKDSQFEDKPVTVKNVFNSQ